MNTKNKKIIIITIIMATLGLLILTIFYFWPAYCQKKFEKLLYPENCPKFFCKTETIGGYDYENEVDWIGKICVPNI